MRRGSKEGVHIHSLGSICYGMFLKHPLTQVVDFSEGTQMFMEC